MFPAAPFLWILVTLSALQISWVHAGAHTVEALYHSSVNFTCNNPTGAHLDLSLYSRPDLLRVWILPNDDLVEFRRTMKHDRVDVLDNGSLLYVREVEDEDFGWYYCMIYLHSEADFFVQKHGLNVNGPFWGDLYELKYKRMVTTGLVAGALCLVSMGLVCFFYGKQQGKLDRPSEEEKAAAVAESIDKGMNETAAPGEPVMVQYVNVAYVADGEDSRAQKPVTQHTTIAYAEERGSKKGPAPGPPGQQEMQNIAAAGAVNEGAASAGVGGVGGGNTKL